MKQLLIIVLTVTVYCFTYPVSCVNEYLGCDPGWIDGGNGYCYIAETTKLVTRENAKRDCKNKNANLLRVTSADEMSLLTNTVWPPMFSQSDGFWTDLSDLRFDGTKTSSGHFNWGSYIPLDNTSISWEKYPTTVPSDACGAVNNQGKMTNWHCNRKMGYICQGFPSANFQCPIGWQSSTDTCYFFGDTTDNTKLLDWTTANQYCMGLKIKTNLTSVGLLVIDDSNDMNVISSTIAQAGTTSVTFWIGLQRSGTTWKWYNNVVFHKDYIQWAAEPDNLNNNENCAIIKPDLKFADQDCSMTFNYICRRVQDTDNTQYFWGCGGWTRAGHKCYSFQYAPRMSWQSARSSCQAVGGDLLKVNTPDEQHWIENKMQDPNQPYIFLWSGLNDQAVEGSYRWTDGQYYNKSLVYWDVEPNNFRGNQDCVTIRIDGIWDDATCTSPIPFICEYQNLEGNCPQTLGWHANTVSGECYYFSSVNDTRTWYEADNYCRKTLISGLSTPLQVSLLAVNSQDELAFIKGILKNTIQPDIWKGFWTDLNDRQVEGQFLYTDNINNPPDLSLIQWMAEPYDPDGSKDCSYVTYNGHFVTASCDSKFGFICERNPTGYSNISYKPAPMKGFSLILVLISSMIRISITK